MCTIYLCFLKIILLNTSTVDEQSYVCERVNDGIYYGHEIRNLIPDDVDYFLDLNPDLIQLEFTIPQNCGVEMTDFKFFSNSDKTSYLPLRNTQYQFNPTKHIIHKVDSGNCSRRNYWLGIDYVAYQEQIYSKPKVIQKIDADFGLIKFDKQNFLVIQKNLIYEIPPVSITTSNGMVKLYNHDFFTKILNLNLNIFWQSLQEKIGEKNNIIDI